MPIVTGIYKEGIKQIQKNNLKFVKFKWIRTTNDIIDRLYSKDKNTKNHYHLLVRSLFNQGYSLACIVKPTSEFESFPVAEFLKNLKGPTDPALFRNTHLRKMFDTENKVMNHIHTGDTTFDVLRESGLFFSGFVGETAIPCPAQTKYEYRLSTSVYYAVYNIKSSIYGKFGKINSIDLDNLFEQEKNLSIIRNKNKTNITDLEKICQLQHDCIVENDIFDKKIQDLFELVVRMRYAAPYMEQILSACNRLDVDCDSWDEITLRSQAIQGDPEEFLWI